MRGRHFIIRSLICSSISEVLISFIIYPPIFYPKGLGYALFISLGTSIIKILLTIPLVFLAKLLVVLYRFIDNIEDTTYNQEIKAFVE